MRKHYDVTLDEDVLKQVDKKRGIIPRSTLINDLLKKWLEEKEK